MSFYMQCRLYNTREFVDFALGNWLDKASWFDIKLIVDLIGDNATTMNNDSYSQKLKSILQQLGLPCCDLLHLGPKLGSKLFDLLEEDTREIKRMGQWADGVWENACSSKLPFGPIRKLAGHVSKDEFHFNTRTSVKPSQVLLMATPIGEWAYDACESVRSYTHEVGKASTAVQALHFFMDLNEVFLQDAAALLVLQPERQTHPILHEANPMDADSQRVLPGVFRWHQANQMATSALTATVHEFIDEFREGVKTMQAGASAANANREELAASFLQIARSLSRSPEREGNDPVEAEADFNQFESLLRAPTVTQEESPPQLDELPHNMTPRHKNLRDLWDEWHGLGRFQDSYGGIKGREELFKNKWRKHVNNAFFCRTKQCVFGIKVCADAHKMPIPEALDVLQKEHVDSGCSVANLMRRFQANGMLQKKNSRGRTKTD